MGVLKVQEVDVEVRMKDVGLRTIRLGATVTISNRTVMAVPMGY
jgi:hypothetical protein